MTEELNKKIREAFGTQTIYKDTATSGSLFDGRTLPSFVKDFLLKKYIDAEGIVDKKGLTMFLDKVIPRSSTEVKDRLGSGEEMTLLTRFEIYIDLVKGLRRFAIPDMGIKIKEGIIPDYVYNKHQGQLVDGEKWGVIKLCVMPDDDGKKNHVEMTEFKPFKPYRSIDMAYFREARKQFTTEEWVNVLLSAMEYNPDGFETLKEKLEFLTRLLIFVEPRLNIIELAPKGTGKSYVFGNMSKYGWLVSGGKVSRAKLFYDKQKQQTGIIKNHDFTAFDEIQTIVFQERAEIQAALKAYLEQGKTTIDNFEFISDCGLMLMGNIDLDSNHRPISRRYFDKLPESFRESALLDRFHGFIEGWYLPRINKDMIFKGWTVNVEYFSEVLHTLRTQTIYGQLFDELVRYERKADNRDFNAVKRLTVAYMKLLFPQWTAASDVSKSDLETYCLQPAIHRRGIIKSQCHNIDPEFKVEMPEFWVDDDI